MVRRPVLTLLIVGVLSLSHAMKTEGFTVYTGWPFDAAEAQQRQLETAQLMGQPVEFTVMLPGNVPFTMVLIPAGRALLGNPPGDAKYFENEIIRSYTQTKPLYVGKYHLTQEQFAAVLGRNPPVTQHGSGPRLPAVAWYDVFRDSVLPALQTHMPSGVMLRIPDISEWEYACRAGVNTDQYFILGNTEEDLGRGAWYSANSGGTMHDVGLKLPNAWGLYDMQGNMYQYDNSVYAWDTQHQYRFAMGGAYYVEPWYNGIRIANEWGYPGEWEGVRFFADVPSMPVSVKSRRAAAPAPLRKVATAQQSHGFQLNGAKLVSVSKHKEKRPWRVIY